MKHEQVKKEMERLWKCVQIHINRYVHNLGYKIISLKLNESWGNIFEIRDKRYGLLSQKWYIHTLYMYILDTVYSISKSIKRFRLKFCLKVSFKLNGLSGRRSDINGKWEQVFHQ